MNAAGAEWPSAKIQPRRISFRDNMGAYAYDRATGGAEEVRATITGDYHEAASQTPFVYGIHASMKFDHACRGGYSKAVSCACISSC